MEKEFTGYFPGYDDPQGAAIVAELLHSDDKTLAIAESCTGGKVASIFTEMSGAADYFLGGVVSYNKKIKSEILGVRANDIENYGAVSKTVAEQMAEGVKKVFGSDYSVSTTGVAGPTRGGEKEPVGTVWIAVAYPGGIISRKMIFGKERISNIEKASTAAINMLRLIISGNRILL